MNVDINIVLWAISEKGSPIMLPLTLFGVEVGAIIVRREITPNDWNIPSIYAVSSSEKVLIVAYKSDEIGSIDAGAIIGEVLKPAAINIRSDEWGMTYEIQGEQRWFI